MVSRYTSFKWGLTIVTLYVFYAWTFICPINNVSPFHKSHIKPLSPINYNFCTVSDRYFKPIYLDTVIPAYQSNVYPIVHACDETLGLAQKYETGISVMRAIDDKVHLVSNVKLAASYLWKYVAVAGNYLQVNVVPYFEVGYQWIESRFIKYCSLLKYQWDIFYPKAWTWISTSIASDIVRQGWSKFVSLKAVQSIIEWYSQFFKRISESKHAAKSRQMTQFLKNEFKNLHKFDEFTPNEAKSKNIVQIVKDLLNIYYEEEYSSSDYEGEEHLTIVITSTITASTITASSTSALSVETDPVISQLQDEINYWQKKVNKTIELAVTHLELEMKTKIEHIIESIKPNISSEFQDLQKNHYMQYKSLNEKISKIHKDAERIADTNDTSIETITRQEIRDDIAASYSLADQCSQRVQSILTENHNYILEQYFTEIQNTIDILETYSETTMTQFSNRLTALITDLDIVDDAVSWKMWQQFHKIKESLFDFRDYLYDSAHEYKKDNKKAEMKVVGMNEWNEYLKNIEFHLNFLIRDNADYLQLVRAKANVAFQLREGLVHDLTQMEKRGIKLIKYGKLEEEDTESIDDVKEESQSTIDKGTFVHSVTVKEQSQSPIQSESSVASVHKQSQSIIQEEPSASSAESSSIEIKSSFESASATPGSINVKSNVPISQSNLTESSLNGEGKTKAESSSSVVGSSPEIKPVSSIESSKQSTEERIERESSSSVEVQLLNSTVSSDTLETPSIIQKPAESTSTERKSTIDTSVHESTDTKDKLEKQISEHQEDKSNSSISIGISQETEGKSNEATSVDKIMEQPSLVNLSTSLQSNGSSESISSQFNSSTITNGTEEQIDPSSQLSDKSDESVEYIIEEFEEFVEVLDD
ncbi:SHE10 [[Candida] subhashii]|uniref:SHE10 n=1 Tax=[Candida] subhashii TaxID=561895 RepID=A0A8J5UUE0_9ASCO|nr:SHE10 [[Candida] subhashii]KAG7665837.1 SHE10 [[Candida] subhashii]